MATQFFSDEQMERLRSYPDIGREELIRFFTLTRKDLGFVDNLGHGGGRGPAARLGLAVQLCTLPWLGFVPDDIWSVPQAAVLRLANQLEVFPGVLQQYGRRAQTISDHLKLVLRYLDWKPVPTGGEPLKDLEQFLQDRAMEHDTPSLLFHQAAEFLVSAHVTQHATRLAQPHRHDRVTRRRAETRNRTIEALRMVGIADPETVNAGTTPSRTRARSRARWRWSRPPGRVRAR